LLMTKWTIPLLLECSKGLVCITGYIKKIRKPGKFIQGRRVYYMPESGMHVTEQAGYIKQLRSRDKTAIVFTHSAFLVSDFAKEDILVVTKDGQFERSEFQTLGASVNKINMVLLGQHETIGDYSKGLLNKIDRMPRGTLNEVELALHECDFLGDSLERTLLMHSLFQAKDELKGGRE